MVVFSVPVYSENDISIGVEAFCFIVVKIVAGIEPHSVLS